MIRDIKIEDAAQICKIYNGYIRNSSVTLETKSVSVDEMKLHIQRLTRDYPWIVFKEDENILGYCYATRWKERDGYRHSVETGTYVHPEQLGKGIGTKVKTALIEELRNSDVHSVISGISLPNPASVALSEKLGFKKVAHFKEVGYKLGQWVDVGYWQLLL